jgi:ketosteroid isomerase-like protein
MRALLATVVVAIAVGGCGASDTDQVHATLDTFARAVAKRDARPICAQVLAPALVARIEGLGLSCRYAIQRFFFSCSVESPTLAVGRVQVNGDNASALVYAGASGQTPGIFQLGLVKTSRGWRVASEAAEKVTAGRCSRR